MSKVTKDPKAAKPSFSKALRLFERKANSFFATICAPLSGRHSLRTDTRKSDDSFLADSGFSLEYIKHLRWKHFELTKRVCDDCLDHPEILTEFGILVHFEYPKLLDKMEDCLTQQPRTKHGR